MTNIRVNEKQYRKLELGDGMSFWALEDNLESIKKDDTVCMNELTVKKSEIEWHKVIIYAESKEAGEIYVVLNLRRLRDIRVLTKIMKQAEVKNLKNLSGKSFHGLLFRI